MSLEAYTIYLYLKLLGSIGLLIVLIKLYQKAKSYFRWKRIEKQSLSIDQVNFLEQNFKPYQYLNEQEQQRLQKKVLYFLTYKNFYPIQNFPIDENIKLIIAAQACLLIINLNIDVYPNLKSIYISAYPFMEKENTVSLQTMLPAHVPRLGESWKDGPVVLAWSSVKQGLDNWRGGHNVIIHEFAHQLDSQDGHMDGLPELEEQYTKKWEFLMSSEFKKLRKKVRKQQKSDIDPYGSKSAVEFFAVTVEEFFTKSAALKKNHFELYQLYQNYFKLNPAQWHS